MATSQKTSREANYGPQRHLTLKSRLFVLLRDELGLGRQPKIAQLLCDEIVNLVDECFVSPETLQVGQALVLACEQGQSNSFQHGLDQVRTRPVRLTLLTSEDIEQLAKGQTHIQVRMTRIARMTHEAHEQGACLTTSQLGLLMGLSPGTVSAQVRQFHEEHKELLPLRGIIEDCSSATTHKAEIVRLHLEGLTTSQIAQRTKHNPKNVERYIQRFNQVREFVHYLDKQVEPAVIARILSMSEKLTKAYLAMIPEYTHPNKQASL